MAKQHNYFSTMIERYNSEDFLIYLKPEQIQRSAKERIFREITKGQIDYTVYGKYFLDMKFLENVLIAAYNEYNNNSAIFVALDEYDMNHPGSGIIINNKTIYGNRMSTFDIIIGRLNSVKMYGNIGPLTDIHYILKDAHKYM